MIIVIIIDRECQQKADARESRSETGQCSERARRQKLLLPTVPCATAAGTPSAPRAFPHTQHQRQSEAAEEIPRRRGRGNGKKGQVQEGFEDMEEGERLLASGVGLETYLTIITFPYPLESPWYQWKKRENMIG